MGGGGGGGGGGEAGSMHPSPLPPVKTFQTNGYCSIFKDSLHMSQDFSR